MPLRVLLVLLAVSGCSVEIGDVATAEVAQEVGSYCYGGGLPIQCSPWNSDGDWNFCQLNCMAFEGTDGYCPETTAGEYNYCRDPANASSRYCYLGLPRFPHDCVSGEFPLVPDQQDQ